MVPTSVYEELPQITRRAPPGRSTRPFPVLHGGRFNLRPVLPIAQVRSFMRVLDMLSRPLAPVPTAPLPRNRILVVDDDPVVRRMFQRSLELARFDVVVADGGAPGLQILQEDETIGLVLLDLTMPDMDGWRFRHAQRLDPRLAQIPTVIVSGSPLGHIVHEELRATDYLLKPVGREHLLSVVASYCKPTDE